MNQDWKRGIIMKTFMLGCESPFVFPLLLCCRSIDWCHCERSEAISIVHEV